LLLIGLHECCLIFALIALVVVLKKLPLSAMNGCKRVDLAGTATDGGS
jgi:hypothetical protein